MPNIAIREMAPEDRYFIGTCSHINESAEADASSARRLAYMDALHSKGFRALAAYTGGEPVAFAYITPIEIAPWGPLGQDLAVIPCLYVPESYAGRGLGRRLVEAAEGVARDQGLQGIVVRAYYHDFWFMPAPFFEHCGFEPVSSAPDQSDNDEPMSKAALLWKIFKATAKLPQVLEPNYTYEPIPDRVRVDLFHNTFCATSDIEAQRVREVAAEFGDRVALYEYCNDNPDILRRYQIPRGIFVNGQQVDWGYEAPREGLREALRSAL